MKMIFRLGLMLTLVISVLMSGSSLLRRSFATAFSAPLNSAPANAASDTMGKATLHYTASKKQIRRGHKHLRLAFITNNASDYWTPARRGVEEASRQLPGVEVQFKIPGAGTADEQKEIVNDLLIQHVDGLAISPIDPPNQVAMLNNAARKTLVLTQDNDAPTSNRVCYIGTDNYAAGIQAGQQIKQALPQGGDIMLFVGSLDAENAQERRRGIIHALKGSRVHIIDTLTDETDHAKALGNAQGTLIKYPNLAGMVGLWSYNGPALYHALRLAHKEGKVKIVCFDEEPDTLDGVANGAIAATIVMQPYELGYQSIVIMAKYLHGDKFAVPPNRHIFIPTLVINRNTLQAYKSKQNQLRGYNH